MMESMTATDNRFSGNIRAARAKLEAAQRKQSTGETSTTCATHTQTRPAAPFAPRLQTPGSTVPETGAEGRSAAPASRPTPPAPRTTGIGPKGKTVAEKLKSLDDEKDDLDTEDASEAGKVSGTGQKFGYSNNLMDISRKTGRKIKKNPVDSSGTFGAPAAAMITVESYNKHGAPIYMRILREETPERAKGLKDECLEHTKSTNRPFKRIDTAKLAQSSGRSVVLLVCEQFPIVIELHLALPNGQTMCLPLSENPSSDDVAKAFEGIMETAQDHETLVLSGTTNPKYPESMRKMYYLVPARMLS